jgi:hypothetical protein
MFAERRPPFSQMIPHKGHELGGVDVRRQIFNSSV